jgi:hypothetical protein
MAVRCQVHKKSYHNGVLVYEVCSKFGTQPYLKASGTDTVCFSVGTRSCTIESRSSRDTLRLGTCPILKVYGAATIYFKVRYEIICH